MNSIQTVYLSSSADPRILHPRIQCLFSLCPLTPQEARILHVSVCCSFFVTTLPSCVLSPRHADMEDYTDIASRLASVGIVGNAKGGEFDVVDIKNYINGVVEPQTSPSPFVPYPVGFLARQSAGALVELINQTSRPKKTMLIGHEKIFSSKALDALTPSECHTLTIYPVVHYAIQSLFEKCTALKFTR